MRKIAIIPGDGIGIDVTAEAVKVLKAVIERSDLDLQMMHFDYGAEKYLSTGITLPEEQLEEFRHDYDAIFVGALGDPRIPDMAHARDILLGMRFKLDLYVNYRPVRLLNAKYCPLKDKKPEDMNFVVFRENTEGIYTGIGGIFKKGTPDEVAVQQSLNTRKGVERIIRYAFEYAREHGLHKVVMSDKGNAMRYEGDLWERVFEEVGGEYPEIEKSHLYVDALVMQMVKRPEQFEVIVTCNMFGDIVTDLGAQLQGGLGLAGSGNLNPGKVSLFEPVHGSAPKYTNLNVANPLAAISTVAIMLEYLGFQQESNWVNSAVRYALDTDNTTRDLGGRLGTRQVGDFITDQIKKGTCQ